MARLRLAALALLLVGCGEQLDPVAPSVAAQPVQDPAPAHVAAPRTGHACLAAGFPTRFDKTIAHAEQRYLPASWRSIAPCGWRAQLAAESGLNDAWCQKANPSGTTASCLAQITEGAAADARRAAGILHSRHNPQASIRAGAWYLSTMRRVWSEPRSVGCRRELSVASYHGGVGTLIDGQRLARAAGRVARCYDDGIGEYLPRHGTENRAYVARVHELQQEMSQ